MPPKPKKSSNLVAKKKGTARKRPSQTNLLASVDATPRVAKKNTASVMMSVDNDATVEVQTPVPMPQTTRRSTAAPTPPVQMVPMSPKPQKEVLTKTMMLPPTMQMPPPPPPPPASHAPLQPVSMPQNPPPLQNPPRPPPMATASMLTTQNAPPPSQLPPYQPPQQVHQPLIQNPPATMAPPPVIKPPEAVTPQNELMIPMPGAALARKKMSRERDPNVSVDEGETSDKRKKMDVINSWIRLVLANGVDGLRKEYRDTPNEAPLDRATVFLDNPTRNRYNDIPCCDMTRVKLPDDPHYYLHANLVSSGPNPRRFICTQGPLVSTIEDFWKMVIVSGLEYIVMLCEVVEKGKPKSAEYFPTKLGECMKIGKLCTITKEASVDLDKNLSVATLRISKIGDTAIAMTVKHIHWHQWPDHGVPDNFLSPFRLLTTFKNSVKPIVVHCSAGVGRTGTLVLILIILESLRLPEFLGVPRLLTRLREERYKSIQTEMQYLYVHRCILEYLVLKKYECNKELYAKFSKDYAMMAEQCEK